ncbi:Rab43 protein [Phlyctochytrium arcticum]|nr:Rab43 protein [Phlyctochytrium arcticum]
MARNEEKAQSMLYRFREAQAAELGFAKSEKRPYLVSNVHTLKDAEKWRHQTIRDISKKVTKIQDSGLTDYQVRDLNDEINKLIREKRRWETRIRELGGADYKRGGVKLLDEEGKEVPGNRGYKYFGRARDLPGVRELFEQKVPEPVQQSRYDIRSRVDADYYGYRDEEDGILLKYERKQARKELAQATAEDESFSAENGGPPDGAIPAKALPLTHISIPSQKEVEAWLVRRRQQELTDRFLNANTISTDPQTA